MKEKESKSKSSTNGVELSPEKLEDALMDMWDLASRALLQHTFIILGDAGLAMKEKRTLTGSGIDVGIPEKYLTKEVLNTFRTFHPEVELTAQGLTYIHFGVPVRIKFIQNNYKFFEHPEAVFYAAEDFQIPNPFNKYYKARYLIR